MRIIVENGLPEILAERRIRSASALARLMAPYLGKQLSTSQITRYMRDAPPAFDLVFIGAACSALRCLPTDLFNIRIECGADDDLAELGSLPKRVEVVRTRPHRSSSSNADSPGESGAKRSNEGRSKAKESIHTGPRADIFPFRRK